MNNFALVGEKVIRDVVGKLPDENFGGIQENSRKFKKVVQQTRLDFDKLKVPFTVRDGSFSLGESYINGPVLGATLRGRVDLKNKKLDLAGTYVPLYGLNSTLGAVPVLGDILVGRKGEGMFGITFGIRGPTKNPEVIVNPVSLITPGIFRQITEFTTRDDEEKLKKRLQTRKPFDAFGKN